MPENSYITAGGSASNPSRLSAGMSQGANIPYNGLEWRSAYEPKSHVYVYNVSSRTFPAFGKLARSIPGVVDSDPSLSGMKDNEKYHYVTSFPQPILIVRENNDANLFGHIEQDAVRYVIDLISPDNMTRTLNTRIDPLHAYSVGNDLAQKGVFFSESNPPKEIEVRQAIDRMETYYTTLLDEAGVLELTDKAKLSERLAGNPDYAYAAKYFNREVSWNKRQVRPTECPSCGEMKTSGKKFHMNSFGRFCVEPSISAWQAAVNSGNVDYDKVPDDFKWHRAKIVEPSQEAAVNAAAAGPDATNLEKLAARLIPTLTKTV